MSSYRHDLKKFADSGLQLRLPVDLVPATQYSRLTNALPVIEGELTAREGLVLVASIYISAAVVELSRDAGQVGNASAPITGLYFPASTGPASSAGFYVGQQLQLTITGNPRIEPVTWPLGSYLITLTAAQNVGAFHGFTFTPAINGANWGAWGTTQAPVYAQVVVQTVGLTTLPNDAITNIFRLNQSIPGLTGDMLVAFAGRVFRAPLTDLTVFHELERDSARAEPTIYPIGLSGNTLAIAEFRFTNDNASWAVLADANGMFRCRENADNTNTGMSFYKLGKPAPTQACTASDGGAGNLDSSGGNGFDWRYTWHDSVVNTEGNPSPITTGAADTERPTAFVNSGVSSPANAYDSNISTFATAVGTANSVVDPNPPFGNTQTLTTQSCIYKSVNNPASPPAADVFLHVIYDATLNGTNGNAVAKIEYSVDAGATWTSAVTAGGSQAYTTVTKTLPTGVNYANIQVRITAAGTSAYGNGSVTMTLRVYDINVTTSATTGALSLVNKQASVRVANPDSITGLNDGRITGIRLYRRGGSLVDTWRLVGTFALAGLTPDPADPAGSFILTDNVSDATLASQPIIQLDNDEPVSSVSTTNQPLPVIWGPVGLDARMLGCGDPNRPECVYFSKSGNCDAWPPQNFIEVCEPGTPIIAGCVFNTRTYAFSREGVYELVQGLGTGTTFTPFKTPSVHGLYSPWGLAVGPAIYFVSKDGIYMTTGGQETSLVENDIKPLFPTYDSPGQDVHGYEAVDYSQRDAMRLRYHNNELYFLYIGATTGTRRMLIYDIYKKRWRAASYTVGMSEVYSEPNTTSSLLFGSSGGSIYEAGATTDPTELEVIENAAITAGLTIGCTITPGTYIACISRFSQDGEVALSPLVPGLSLDATHGVGVTFPAVSPAGTTKWRIYFGLSVAAVQYVEFTEADLAARGSRSVIVSAPGTSGTIPMQNATDAIACVLRTGAHDQGAPLNRKQYGNVLIDLDPGGANSTYPVTITPYINGEAQAESSLTVTGSGRQQVPLDLSDFFAFNTEYEVRWKRLGAINPTLYQYDTLHFFEPVGVTHWQAQPTSFGFPGFVHCRDAYIAIRSTTPITLTMTFDGISQTYTIPSTNGQRRKVYVQFASNKGLLYQFALDAAAEFRVYEEDLEIRVKPWLGLLGYSVLRVLGGETAA